MYCGKYLPCIFVVHINIRVIKHCDNLEKDFWQNGILIVSTWIIAERIILQHNYVLVNCNRLEIAFVNPTGSIK